MLSKARLFHHTGDLIFCRDSGILSRILCIGQHYIDGVPAQFSHVALCIYPGLLIHSVPGGGVQLLKVEEKHRDNIDFACRNQSNLQVLRLTNIGLEPLHLIHAMLYWTGQSYNFNFRQPLSRIGGKAYCSQFLVQVLDRAGIALEGLGVEDPITPSALNRAARSGAEDVTAGYREYAALLKSDPQEKYLLSRDFARDMILSGAEQNLRQAKFRHAVNMATARASASNAANIGATMAAVRKLRGGVVHLEGHCRDIREHVTAALLLFETARYAAYQPGQHHLDRRAAPAPLVGGTMLHRSVLSQQAEQTALLDAEFDGMADMLGILERALGGGRPGQALELNLAGAADFLALCSRRIVEFNCPGKDALLATLSSLPPDMENLAGMDERSVELCRILRTTKEQWESLSLNAEAIRHRVRRCAAMFLEEVRDGDKRERSSKPAPIENG